MLQIHGEFWKRLRSPKAEVEGRGTLKRDHRSKWNNRNDMSLGCVGEGVVVGDGSINVHRCVPQSLLYTIYLLINLKKKETG